MVIRMPCSRIFINEMFYYGHNYFFHRNYIGNIIRLCPKDYKNAKFIFRGDEVFLEYET